MTLPADPIRPPRTGAGDDEAADARPEPLRDRAASVLPDGLAFHAAALAHAGAGVLILGPSGAGKSALALTLLASGAALISDDLAVVSPSAAGLVLRPPPRRAAAIEARGVGLLDPGPMSAGAPLSLVVDLSRAEPRRLPPRRQVAMAGHRVPLILGADAATLAPVVLLILRRGYADIHP